MTKKHITPAAAAAVSMLAQLEQRRTELVQERLLYRGDLDGTECYVVLSPAGFAQRVEMRGDRLGQVTGAANCRLSEATEFTAQAYAAQAALQIRDGNGAQFRAAPKSDAYVEQIAELDKVIEFVKSVLPL